MIKNLNDLQTPEEFIDFYLEELKRELSSSQLQVSKVGLIGYFLNILGNIQYDIKQYYQYLFNESFPISAVDDLNLISHSKVFGFDYDLAVPSILEGTIKVNMDILISLKQSNSHLVIEPFGDDTTITESLMVSNIPFTMTSKYTFLNIDDVWKVIITTVDKKTQYYTLNLLSPYIPIVGFQQYIEMQQNSFTIPNYIFGTFYTIKVEIPSDQDICLISITVTENNSTVPVVYDAKKIKVGTTPEDTVIFYRITNIDGNKFIVFELGSGTQGKYIPNSIVNISIKTTFGDKGNVGQNEVLTSNLIVDNNIVSDLFEFRISGSSGGQGILSKDRLRIKLLEYIQHRDNLISETDYSQIIKSKFKYNQILFRKLDLQTNDIFIYISLLDKLFQPIRITTLWPDISDINNNFKYIINQEDGLIQDTYLTYPIIDSYKCPFILKTDSSLTYYEAYLIQNVVNSQFTRLENYDQTNTGVAYLSRYVELQTNPAIKHYDQIIIQEQVIPFSDCYLSISVLFSHNVNNEDSLKLKFNVSTLQDLFNDTNLLLVNIGCEELGIKDQEMTIITSVSAEFIIDIYSLPKKHLDVVITLFRNTFVELVNSKNNARGFSNALVKNCILYFDNITIIYDFSDFFRYKQITYSNKTYLSGVPFILDNSDFELLQQEIVETLTSTLNTIDISNNRMISDDIQLKFLNSNSIPSNLLSTISNIKLYNSNNIEVTNKSLVFPLNLILFISFNLEFIQDQNLNISNEEYLIRSKVSEFLLTNKTGTEIEFFESQILDLLHNHLSIKGARLEIQESSVDKYKVSSNFKIFNQTESIKPLPVIDRLMFTPVLCWWDINNINIQRIS